MIHHISIAARDPRHVADVVAELMGGRAFPFPAIPGSFMAASGDKHGTMIEVHPADLTLEPDGPKHRTERPLKPGPFHVFISVPLSRERIEAIGHREGWTTQYRTRPSASLLKPGQKPRFSLVEVWIEDHFLMEVVPQSMLGDYEKMMEGMMTANQS